jgi:hypothetical protein
MGGQGGKDMALLTYGLPLERFLATVILDLGAINILFTIPH